VQFPSELPYRLASCKVRYCDAGAMKLSGWVTCKSSSSHCSSTRALCVLVDLCGTRDQEKIDIGWLPHFGGGALADLAQDIARAELRDYRTPVDHAARGHVLLVRRGVRGRDALHPVATDDEASWKIGQSSRQELKGGPGERDCKNGCARKDAVEHGHRAN
jgi:hypothetical protein